MRVTRSWLGEFLSLEGVDDGTLYHKFIAIGHEVASMERFSFDPLVVVGRVVSAQKHPDADKLSICLVDVGEKELSIVCGAPNVSAGQFVPVAQVGATLPGGLTIRDAQLRGVASSGMICSAGELGLPCVGDGILELDGSIGDLTPGWQLNNYPKLADTLYELELTANRGDCLSVYGVARDLSAALDLPLYPTRPDRHDQSAMGIGRVLQLVSAPEASASVVIRVIENNSFLLPLLLRLRLGWLESAIKKPIERLCEYATHATGVLFRAFDIKAFCQNPQERGVVRLKKNGAFNTIEGAVVVERIGVDVQESYQAHEDSPLMVLSAFYVDPDEVAMAVWQEKETGDRLHALACKGSEPDLQMGMRFFCELLSLTGTSRFYSEALSYEPSRYEQAVGINTDHICALIGQEVPKNQIVSILKKLGAKTHASGDQNSFALIAPPWRHDLKCAADVTEEVVRILGIDQIASKPLALPEVRGVGPGWQRFRHERSLAYRAASQGYFESLHFLFCDAKAAVRFGFAPMEPGLDLANPITAELDALRPSLLINLVQAASKNHAHGHERVRLFEIGDVYDRLRQHGREMAFVLSGALEPAHLGNHGKPPAPTLGDFVRQVAGVVGAFELREISAPKAYLQPGQCAQVLRNEVPIGIVGKLHPSLACEYDLSSCYVAHFDLGLLVLNTPQAVLKARLQPIWRDMSVVLDKQHRFGTIRQAVMAEKIAYLHTFSAIDRYEDEQLGQKMSLTFRLGIRPEEKSLTDDQIASVVEQVRVVVQNRFQGVLR